MSLTRDLLAAKQAYKEDNIENCIKAHTIGHHHHHVDEEHAPGSREKLKSFVFGGLDGIVTIFCVVAGCQGVMLDSQKLLIIGIANLLGDAVSMGFGEYVSSKTESDFEKTEMRREAWEMENCPEGEKQEMIELYCVKHGFNDNDARDIVEIGWKYPEYFLNHMMVEELGILMDDDAVGPATKGVIMFCSFVLFGCVPLLSFAFYEYCVMGYYTQNHAFLFACIISLLTLFALGGAKAHFVNSNAITSGITMAVNGAIAGAFAYGLGALGNKLAAGISNY